ncbi:MAG: triple tyrosine motif-containing protein, partial [Chryseotalea sp.]
LNLVPEIRKLIVEKNTNTLWVVPVNNELYSLKLEENKGTTVQYPLLVNFVMHNKTYLPQSIRKFEFIQSEQLFNMDVSRPFYANAKDVEYRYWLEGLEGSDFSAWSANSVINFTFLPLGKYKLHVQTRDALHEQSIDEIFEIIVKPPLWKTPWFYASQFVLFGLLVLVSIRLKMNRRYKIFAQLLSVLTIVLLITFIQTVFSTYLSTSSPVVDFGIQVGIALMVLPIELYLRKLMASDIAAEKLKSIITTTKNE